MGATAVLSPVKLAVQPGSEGRCELTVRNTSSVVEEMTFEILGPAAGFARVEPARVPMFPGTEQKVAVIFSPPSGYDNPAGTYDFAVKVLPKEDADGSCVEEGQVELSAFTDSLLEVGPRTSTGRRSGSHTYAIDNRGNADLSSKLRGFQHDNLLTFEFDPPAVSTEPGAASIGKVKVKPVKKFWRGPARSIPFEAYADNADGSVMKSPATFVQNPLLPKWALRLGLFLAIGAIALFVAFQTLVKSSIRSEAKKAAKKEVAPVVTALNNQGIGVPTPGDANGNGIPDTEENPNPDANGNGVLDALENGTPGDSDGDGIPDADDPDADGNGIPDADEKVTATTLSPEAQAAADKAAAERAAAARAAADKAAAEQAARAAAQELLGEGPGGRARYKKRLSPQVNPGETAAADDVIPEDKVLDLTDVVFQNPNGDSGILRVLRDDELLIEINLDNFRDLDYHFVTGTAVKGGEKVVVQVECRNAAGKTCSAAAYLTGTTFSVPAPETAPTTTTGG